MVKRPTDLIPTHYKILGVDRLATIDEITTAYRALALRLHPDANVNKAVEERNDLMERFKFVSHSYEILKDPKTRLEYDKTLPAVQPAVHYDSSGSYTKSLRPHKPPHKPGASRPHVRRPDGSQQSTRSKLDVESAVNELKGIVNFHGGNYVENPLNDYIFFSFKDKKKAIGVYTGLKNFLFYLNRISEGKEAFNINSENIRMSCKEEDNITTIQIPVGVMISIEKNHLKIKKDNGYEYLKSSITFALVAPRATK